MREVLRKAIALNPAFTESYEMLAFVAVVNNDELDDAVAQLHKALKYQPGNQRYALRIAEIYSRQSKFGEAKALADKIARTTDSEEVRLRAEQVMSNVSQREQFEQQRSEILSRSNITPGRSNGPPKLGRRLSDEEMAIRSINDALRPPLDGEKRLVGRVQKIDCSRSPIVYTIAAGGETFTLTSKDFEALTLGAFDVEHGGTKVSCEGGISVINSVITYRTGGGAVRSRGELVALEFVPADFRLLTEEEFNRLQAPSEVEAEERAPAGTPPMIIEVPSGMPYEALRRKMIMESMRASLKLPGPGEKRDVGILEKIECKGRDMIFSFKTRSGIVRVGGAKPPEIILFVQDLAGMQFGCGMKPIEFPAVFIYADKPNEKAKIAGELTYLGFMPSSFTLE